MDRLRWRTVTKAPDEPYFREQRRRFAGEREADDRPPAPLPPWLGPGDAAPRPPAEFVDPGLTV